MNNAATIDKMVKMKLSGMLRAFKNTYESGIKQQFTADELLTHLIDAEWDERQNRRLNMLIRLARFRYQVNFEEIDFTIARNLDKNYFLRFSDCQWLEKKEDIIFSGPTGCGKSFLASALGNQACVYGYRVGYFSSSKLFIALKMSKADGSYLKELNRLQRLELLIIDDFGLEVLDSENRLSLLEILEDRHGRCSTIFVSQLPLSKWHEVIGEDTIADAVCDRIIHGAHHLNLKGDSVRKKLRGIKKEEGGREV